MKPNYGHPMHPLKNTYYVMRHGESEANEKRIIISSPLRGISRYGLTPKGRDEVLRSAQKINQRIHLDYIFSSDFYRALETARLVAAEFHIREVYTSELLRERFFGSLEGGDDSAYHTVWELDAINPDHHEYGVESCREVATRALAFLMDCEQRYYGSSILVVAHGDVLQILLCAVQGIPVQLHRTVRAIEKAEIRPLIAP